MRESVALFDAVHAAMCEHIRPGIAEHELAGELDRALRRAGHDGIVFQRRWDAKLAMEGALASGENLATISRGPITVTGVGLSESFPMGASRRRLERGDLVNIDLGLNRAGYHGDMARTYAVGELPDGRRAAGRQVPRAPGRRARRRSAPACPRTRSTTRPRRRPTASASPTSSRAAARTSATAIGLELDEPPVLGPGIETPIEEGMILAVEPKLISPAFGAVNIEDDVVVTADGCEVLGDLPRAVFVVGEQGEVAWVP